eukprot:4085874-Pleurochrysis_carterae.AAC.2
MHTPSEEQPAKSPLADCTMKRMLPARYNDNNKTNVKRTRDARDEKVRATCACGATRNHADMMRAKNRPSSAFEANNRSSSAFEANNRSSSAFGANNRSSSAFGANNRSSSAFGANNRSSSAFGANNRAFSAFGAHNRSFSAFGCSYGIGSPGGNEERAGPSKGSVGGCRPRESSAVRSPRASGSCALPQTAGVPCTPDEIQKRRCSVRSAGTCKAGCINSTACGN